MRQSRIGEFELIRYLRRATAIPRGVQASVLAGIGDDAAVLKPRPGRVILATTDLLAERIHFDLTFASYRQLGYKAAMANLSDIAAMGGVPRFLLIALALTPRETSRNVEAMYEGIHTACYPSGVAVVGGDLSASRTDLFLAVMVLGDSAPRGVLRRSGARAGDRLYVTGTLGDAQAGLEILLRRRKKSRAVKTTPTHPSPLEGEGEGGGDLVYLIRRHLMPTARLIEGRILADGRLASAAIDVSDGLAGDIRHICEESRVGCLIDARKLPLSPHLLAHAQAHKRDPIAYALSGGEDYELLFTVPPAKVSRVDSLIRRQVLRATPIGQITPRRQGLRLIGVDGSASPLTATGYEHRLG
ncbi:MAG: thiamine-phosphate kinase [Nitrospirae bacterium]|nr:MAG: thiamine-phosphate kinase [Nitrospirota bacterium]